MLNIFRIFISDFKRIKTNVVAVVIVVGSRYDDLVFVTVLLSLVP
jgi:hypothetical protein